MWIAVLKHPVLRSVLSWVDNLQVYCLQLCIQDFIKSTFESYHVWCTEDLCKKLEYLLSYFHSMLFSSSYIWVKNKVLPSHHPKGGNLWRTNTMLRSQKIQKYITEFYLDFSWNLGSKKSSMYLETISNQYSSSHCRDNCNMNSVYSNVHMKTSIKDNKTPTDISWVL